MFSFDICIVDSVRFYAAESNKLVLNRALIYILSYFLRSPMSLQPHMLPDKQLVVVTDTVVLVPYLPRHVARYHGSSFTQFSP